MDSTFDMIRRCPRCEELGNPAGTEILPDRSTLYRFVCDNPNCKWFNSAPWIRQRYPDGTWVQEQKHEKFFPSVPDRTSEVQDAIDLDIARQTGRLI